MTKSKNIFIFTIVFFLILFSTTAYTVENQRGFIPNAYIKGDVQEVINLKELAKIEKIEIEYKNNKLKVYQLKDIIKIAKPIPENYELILSAQDGLRAKISGDKIDKSYINFSSEHGWEAINLNHPISSNIKLIESIIVVSKDGDKKEPFTIITQNENLLIKTPGQFLSDTYNNISVFEGKSSQNLEGKDYSVEIFSEKKVLKPESFIDNNIEDRTIIFNEEGKTLEYNNGYIEIKDNHLNYINPVKKESLQKIRGMVIGAPLKSNKDVYYDVLHYLENNERVLVILLDGFGYHQYEYLKENNQIPFLAKIDNVSKVITSYKPVTNTGLAAVLTGKGPAENGIYNRSFKDLKTPDIFKKATDMGLESSYVEGNIKILNTSIEPILNPDFNENNTTDDEVFEETKKQVNKDIDLIFTHFHGIDDSGHDYGPYGEKTIEVIKKTDSYINDLAQLWNGKIIITSDHGMHATKEGGDHGVVFYQDMFVPYLITEGGKIDE